MVVEASAAAMAVGSMLVRVWEVVPKEISVVVVASAAVAVEVLASGTVAILAQGLVSEVLP